MFGCERFTFGFFVRGFDGGADIGGVAYTDAPRWREDAHAVVDFLIVPRSVVGFGDGENPCFAAGNDLIFQRVALLFAGIAGLAWLGFLWALDALFGRVKKRV